MEVTKIKPFGILSDGRRADIYKLKNSEGSEVKITNYGARVVSWLTPDKNEKFVDVVLGYENVEAYEKDDKFMGAIAGRCANRIAKAKFTLNGKEYVLDQNDGNNHLHGGFNGFDKQLWTVDDSNYSYGLKFKYTSPTGEGGYPGTLNAAVTYYLSDENELIISYEAEANEDTICNLTNHTYFNLNGFASGSVLNQKIMICSDNYTWADQESIPDGRILSVENTPLDLRKLIAIGEHIEDNFDELNFGHGYDHNWCIKDFNGELKKAAYAEGNETGITLTVFTTLPGIQFYTGNFLDGKLAGKAGVHFERRSGFCLETQYYPNAINNSSFLQPILKKNEIWKAETIYQMRNKII